MKQYYERAKNKGSYFFLGGKTYETKTSFIILRDGCCVRRL